MLKRQLFTCGSEILYPCKGMFFAVRDDIIAIAAIAHGSVGKTCGVKNSGGVGRSERFGEVGFIENGVFLGPA